MSDLLKDMGDTAYPIELEPFHADIPDFPDLPSDVAVVCWGERFVPRALNYDLKPGIFFDDESFSWSTCRSMWGGHMLNASAQIMTLSEVRARLAGGRLFVRPNGDNKAFESGVHSVDSLDKAISESRLPPGERADDMTMVVAAEPIDVQSEYRLFVVDGTVVAASSYRHLGVPNQEAFVPYRVIEFGEQAIAKWVPALACCVDIAVTADGRMGVVEANCINAARFYGANGRDVLWAISRLARKSVLKLELETMMKNC